METINNNRVIAVLLVTVLAIVALLSFQGSAMQTENAINKVSAATKGEPAQNSSSTNSQQSSANQPGGRYNYTAKTGDSYSVLARKAVQTYGLVNKVNLSQAQIIAAETALTHQAGSPQLSEGQSVQFDEAKVKSAVQSAQKLSTSEKAAWNTYVSQVDFDTRDNG